MRKKSIGQVIRNHLFLLSIITLLLVFIITNISIQLFFRKYLTYKKEILDEDIIHAVTEMINNNVIDIKYLPYLDRTINRNKVHLILTDVSDNIFYDSKKKGISKINMLGPIMNVKAESRFLPNVKYTSYKLDNSDVKMYIGHQEKIIVSDEDKLFIWSINIIFILVFLFAVIAVLLISKRLSNNLSNPIIEIKHATDKIAKGNYNDVKIMEANTDEIYRLGVAIEQLAKKLDDQEKLRKRLTTDISHELRSPISIVRGQIEAIIDGVLKPTPERLNRINDEIIRLTRLINDLNELSIVENDMIKLNKKITDISVIVQDKIIEYTPLFDEKNIKLVNELEKQSMVNIDEDRFKQIISNLLSNALKYTEEGYVKITIRKLDKYVQIKVQDTGIGISKKDLPYIFERFYRTDSSRNRETGGAGIGLSIVKKLVEIHNGIINVKSKLGEGTEFILLFPKVI